MLARVYACYREIVAERLRRKHVEAQELRVTCTKSALHGNSARPQGRFPDEHLPDDD
jgi:hypothetical protein